MQGRPILFSPGQIWLIVWFVSLACCSPLRSQDLATDEPNDPIGRQVHAQLAATEDSDLAAQLRLLDQIVVWESRFTPKVAVELPRRDYLQLAGRLLGSDLRGLPRDQRLELWLKLSHLAVSLKLDELGQPLADQLDKAAAEEQPLLLQTLVALGARQAVPKGAELLRSQHEAVRKAAVKVLVELRATEAVPVLVERLRAGHHLQRYYALMDLAKIGAPESAAPISELLEDPEPNLRYWALDTLRGLDARQYAPLLWDLTGPPEPPGTQVYAIATLIAWGEATAVPLAVERARQKDLSTRGDMLRALIKTKARAASTGLIALLESTEVLGGDRGTDSNIRRDIMNSLVDLEAREAVPVLCRSVQSPRNSFLKLAAVSALGSLNAPDCVEDLERMLTPHDPEDYHSDVAIALARMGKKSLWPTLVDYAANPDHPYRSHVLCQMNAFIDPRLWKDLHEKRVQGLYVKSPEETAQTLSRESGIEIVLHPRSGPTDAMEREPFANTSVQQINLAYGVYRIIDAYANVGGTSSQDPYTFFFEDGKIHLMPISQAIRWWREVGIPRFGTNSLKIAR